MMAKLRSFVTLFAIAAATLVASPVLAVANSTGYSGQVVSVNGSDCQLKTDNCKLSLKPGETKRVEVGIKNTGTVTWKSTDKAYPIVYTYFPKYRTSAFRAKGWDAKDSPLRLSGSIKPGATATFSFELTAPTKTGLYSEGFWIAAFDKAWIPGTQFKFAITVKGEVVKPVAMVPTKPVTKEVVKESIHDTRYTNPPADAPTIQAQQDIEIFASPFKGIAMATPKVTVNGGDIKTVRVAVKNSGDLEWPGYNVRSENLVQIASATTVPLTDMRAPEWPTANIALVQHYDVVKPGRVLLLDIPFKAPQKKGEYTLAFHLNVASEDVDGGLIEIPVSVTNDAGQPPPPVPTTPYIPNPLEIGQLETEPILRVGLYKTPSGESVSGDIQYHVMDANGKTYFDQPAGSSVTLSYEGGRYKAMSDQGMLAIADAPIRLQGANGEAIFTVVTRPNRPTWNLNLNDNRFRGVIEIRYSVKNATIWIINELPIEEYLKGLIEAGEGSSYPAEYQRALSTAARTYAYYHYTTKSKHADRGFDVDANYDQVYRGYGAESRQPRTADSVSSTHGMIVRYNGGLALTPYYTRSDGRTRSYKEVWGKDIPYLVSVPAPYDAGKALFGHGVGLTAWDAIGHAKYDNWNWQQILKYYYTGVDVEKKW